MDTMNQWKPVSRSVNGVSHLIIAGLTILFMIFGMAEAQAALMATEGVAFFLILREQFKDGLSFTWNWNVLAYAAVILTALLPSLTEAWEQLPELGKFLGNGDFMGAIRVLIVFASIIWQQVRSNKP